MFDAFIIARTPTGLQVGITQANVAYGTLCTFICLEGKFYLMYNSTKGSGIYLILRSDRCHLVTFGAFIIAGTFTELQVKPQKQILPLAPTVCSFLRKAWFN